MSILKIYELPKINNAILKYRQTLALTIIMYEANSMSRLQLASELYPSNFIKNVPLGEKDSFGTELRKILGRIFFLKCSAKKVLLFCYIGCCSYVYNKPFICTGY